jgi:hypothetical protein
MASAPPEPPSPSTTTTIGTCSPVMSLMLDAMACAWPRSSAAGPGKAPEVSRNVTTGIPSLSASRMRRCALRKPSGWGEPKLRRMFDSVSVPFWWPMIITGTPSSRAGPPTIAGSSPKARSPWSS